MRGEGRVTTGARRLALDRNPLRPGAERARVWVVVVGVLVVLVAAPAVGRRITVATYHRGVHTVRSQAAHRHHVTATLLRTATPGVPPPGRITTTADVPARWTAPDGAPRVADIEVHTRRSPGTTTAIWIDDRGDPRPAPLTRGQLFNQALTYGAIGAVGVLVAVVLAGWLARRALIRHRYADWAREWAVVSSRWTQRS